MTEESQIAALARFYFFGLLDESRAKHATIKAIRYFKKRIKRSPVAREDIPSVIVHCTNENWEKYKKLSGYSATDYDVAWVLPDNVDFGSWRAFQNESDEDEFLAVLWSRILCISDAQIARGLGVTEGTVRYRVGRGLRRLGSLLEPNKEAQA